MTASLLCPLACGRVRSGRWASDVPWGEGVAPSSAPTLPVGQVPALFLAQSQAHTDTLNLSIIHRSTLRSMPPRRRCCGMTSRCTRRRRPRTCATSQPTSRTPRWSRSSQTWVKAGDSGGCIAWGLAWSRLGIITLLPIPEPGSPHFGPHFTPAQTGNAGRAPLAARKARKLPKPASAAITGACGPFLFTGCAWICRKGGHNTLTNMITISYVRQAAALGTGPCRQPSQPLAALKTGDC